LQDFVVLRKRLGGFGEAVKSFPLAHIFASSDDMELNIEVKLIKTIKKVLNVFLVQVNFIQLIFFVSFYSRIHLYFIHIFFLDYERAILCEIYKNKYILNEY
jgi:hypothetical protein